MKFSNSLNVLLLGSGGREHAFARKIAESPSVAKLFIAPGNAGTAQCGTNVDINPNNFGSVKQFVLSNNINLVVVGPEEPLVRGIYDFFCEDSQISNIPVIGPSLEGARLEGSKDFAKAFMARHGVPTARYQSFNKNKLPEAEAFIDSLAAPYVLKADGLAAGKGVVILDDAAAAKAELAEMFSGKFGQAGNTVVIDHGCGLKSYLCGLRELSVSEGAQLTQGELVGLAGQEPVTVEMRIGNKSINPVNTFKGQGGLFMK